MKKLTITLLALLMIASCKKDCALPRITLTAEMTFYLYEGEKETAIIKNEKFTVEPDKMYQVATVNGRCFKDVIFHQSKTDIFNPCTY